MPRLGKLRIVSSIVFATLTLSAVVAGNAEAARLTVKERSLVGAVNSIRRAHGLRPLRVDRKLVRTARAYSRRLLRIDVLTHGSFASRIAASGARGPRYGENLAWGVGPRARARSIVRAWLASPTHRANLLRPGWRRIGIGARVGAFSGYGRVTMVTADFAGR